MISKRAHKYTHTPYYTTLHHTTVHHTYILHYITHVHTRTDTQTHTLTHYTHTVHTHTHTTLNTLQLVLTLNVTHVYLSCQLPLTAFRVYLFTEVATNLEQEKYNHQWIWQLQTYERGGSNCCNNAQNYSQASCAACIFPEQLPVYP